jgi:streptomycin 6-kinase
MHGYVAIVIPVRRQEELSALKISWVDEETRHESLALQAWNGVGCVKLLNSAPADGVMLLERLNAACTLREVDIDDAAQIATNLLRRLAITAPPELISTSTIADRHAATLRERWQKLGQPFAESLVETTVESARMVHNCQDKFLVNQDLHYDNVLQGSREPWLVIDPKPVSGDIEFGVAPLLWNRFEEGNIRCRLNLIFKSGKMDKARLKNWCLVRVIDYWLWALTTGFTEDLIRCEQLAASILEF